MTHPIKVLLLALLLMTAQQIGAVHELSHGASHAAASAHPQKMGGSEGGACAVCPLFAQASSPAFGYSFTLPTLARAPLERSAMAALAVVAAPVPTARSRGPPFTR
jgi:hypothetical protein